MSHTFKPVIIEFGRHRYGEWAGKISYALNRDEISNLSEPDLGILHANLMQAADKVAAEYNFRKMKVAELPKEEDDKGTVEIPKS